MPEEATHRRPVVAVLVKAVPDVASIPVDPDTNLAMIAGDVVMNTYDAYAVSEAVRIAESTGGSTIAVTVGPASHRDVLMRALATGIEQGIHLVTDGVSGNDSLATANLIAEVIRNDVVDLVLAGQTSEDFESGQTGIQVAELLGWPHISLVTRVEIVGEEIEVMRDADASQERVACPLPALLTILSGRDGEQRYPTLRGMMAAKRKPLTSQDVPADTQNRAIWTAPEGVRRSASGVILEGVAGDEAVARLVSWLRERNLA